MKIYILVPIALLTVTAPVLAQQQPTLLFTPPSSPPISSQAPPDQGAPPPPAAPAQPEPPPAPAARVFCGQNVTAQAADPRSVPDPYRQLVGIFSDAAWNAQLCAALVVEKLTPQLTALVSALVRRAQRGRRAADGRADDARGPANLPEGRAARARLALPDVAQEQGSATA